MDLLMASMDVTMDFLSWLMVIAGILSVLSSCFRFYKTKNKIEKGNKKMLQQIVESVVAILLGAGYLLIC